MGLNETAIFSQAMRLDAKHRQHLAESLWDSLEIESGLPDERDADFATETSRRRSEVLSGQVTTISHGELKTQLGR